MYFVWGVFYLEHDFREGHRKRVRDEFLKNGFNENTSKYTVLEMLLFYCVPRKDTKELAHTLLDTYKTLGGVLNAPVSELVKYPGITEPGAALLKLILPVANICAAEYKRGVSDFKSHEEMCDYVANRFFGISDERVGILLLDRLGRKLDFRFIGEGDVASVGVSVRMIVQPCLELNAAAVVLAHNHPSGVALPSEQDIAVTISLAKSLPPLSIKLLDHIIVAADDYVSLYQSVRYSEIFK